jgi:tetratricopeptide (TPR) repeat protein
MRSHFVFVLVSALIPILHGRPCAAEMGAFQAERTLAEVQIRRWSKEVSKNPKDFETMAAIASAYGTLHQYEKAVDWYQKALLVNPSYAEAYLGLGAAYGFEGRLDDKIAACKQAIKLKPDYADAYFTLGSAYGKKGQYKEAVQALREGVRLKPASAEGHFALGLAYASSDDLVNASAEQRILMRLDATLAAQLKRIIDAPNP